MKLSDKAYETLTGSERAVLVLNALARRDLVDADLLVDTCPRGKFTAAHEPYTKRAKLLLSLITYNEVKALNLIILLLIYEGGESEDLITKLEDSLLTLEATWRQFCKEIGLDVEAVPEVITGHPSLWLTLVSKGMEYESLESHVSQDLLGYYHRQWELLS